MVVVWWDWRGYIMDLIPIPLGIRLAVPIAKLPISRSTNDQGRKHDSADIPNIPKSPTCI
jgi:hypothetical protein